MPDTVARGARQAKSMLDRNAPVLIAIVAICVIGTIGSDAFLTTDNFLILFRRIAGVGIIAAGTTVLMVAGGIDLSIGSAVSFISIIVARAVNAGHGDLVVVALAVGVGAAIGAALGLVIVLTKAPPFMVTLGALSVLAGISIWQTDARPVPIGDGFDTLGVRRIGSLPVGFIVLVVVLVGTYVFLHHLRPGRLAFAVGGNETAARLGGVAVGATKVGLYVLNGALVGLGAAVITSRVGSGSTQTGTGLELEVIAAVVIGGASLAGGSGSVSGTFLGVFLLGAITSALNLLGAGTYLQDIIFGAFIVLAVSLRSAILPARWRRRPWRQLRPPVVESEPSVELAPVGSAHG